MSVNFTIIFSSEKCMFEPVVSEVIEIIANVSNCSGNYCVVVLGDDISKPLKHSFIHTGHADATGKLWGDPGQIDE